MRNFKRVTWDYEEYEEKKYSKLCVITIRYHIIWLLDSKRERKRKSLFVRLDMNIYKFMHTCIQVYVQTYACTYLYLDINLAK